MTNYYNVELRSGARNARRAHASVERNTLRSLMKNNNKKRLECSENFLVRLKKDQVSMMIKKKMYFKVMKKGMTMIIMMKKLKRKREAVRDFFLS